MEIANLSLALLMFFFLMVLLNYFTMFRLDKIDLNNSTSLPSASVLIPARNEAHNLVNLIPTLLSSKFKSFEIIILDDDSEDDTKEIALQLLRGSKIPNQVVMGKKWIPSCGLSGKNHACQQLFELANSEILIFCDADVSISDNAIEKTLRLIQQNPKASGMSGLAKVKASGFFESLIYPWIMQIPLMISLPLGFAWRLPIPKMQMANGQWLAIRKEAYLKIGGHQALGFNVVEDVNLARSLVQNSLGGLIPVLATKDITVRMYTDWKSMVLGFSKNLIFIYGGRPIYFIFLLSCINFVFFYPFFLIHYSAVYSFFVLIILFFLRFTIGIIFENSFYRSLKQFVMHWPSILVLNYFSILVVCNHLHKKTDWKGRKTFSGDL